MRCVRFEDTGQVDNPALVDVPSRLLLDSRRVMRLKAEGTTSISAMVLALLASQHHNVHMALLAIGLGGTGMTFMSVYPGIRRAMLLLSLAVVAVNLRSLRGQSAPPAMRAVVLGFSVLTAAAIAWSVFRFGL